MSPPGAARNPAPSSEPTASLAGVKVMFGPARQGNRSLPVVAEPEVLQMNDSNSDASAPVTDATEALRADIERTRDQLGQTVDALAAKTDVKGRAQQKVSEISARLAGPLAASKERVAEAGKTVADKAAAVGSTGGMVTGAVQQQAAGLADSAAAAIGKGTQALPEPAQKAVGQASSFISRYRVQLVAGVAAVIGLIIIRRRSSR
jgi:hypothetical protein